MDNQVKQRNRRRKRAQRMQAQRANKAKDGDSAEDESPVREKPVRPPNRRKKSKEPLVEEDIIDGFAILGFKTFEDLELQSAVSIATTASVLSGKQREKCPSTIISASTGAEEKPKLDTGQRTPASAHHISSHPPTHGLLLTHGDAGTSDDSGRASERLTGSSVAPRDPDSSRDRLSDASSRCSSGKGYICDSEGEDDKGSDAGSVLFASTPTPQRKHEFPGCGLPPGVPGGGSASPVPAPASPCLAPPAPSPAPAALPPHSALPQAAAAAAAAAAYTASPLVAASHVISVAEHLLPKPPAGAAAAAAAVATSLLSGHGPAPRDPQVPAVTAPTTGPPPHLHAAGALPPHGQVPANHGTPSHAPNTQMIPPSHLGPGHATSLLNHQIPPSLSASQPALVPSSLAQHISHAPSHLTNVSNSHSMSQHTTTPATVNSPCMPNHVLASQPSHSLSNHPVPSLAVSRAPSPPPPLSAATPPASLPAALPQPASAPVVPSHHEVAAAAAASVVSSLTATVQPSFIPNGAAAAAAAAVMGNGGMVGNGNGLPLPYQQTAATTFPSYPPLYAPYAASMRNSVPVSSPNLSHRTAAPTMPSPTVTQANVSTASVVAVPHISAISTSHRESVTTATLTTARGTHSPRGHSPNRERDSYSSNVSSLSRGSVTPVSLPYSSASVTSSSLSSSTYAFSKAAAWNAGVPGPVPQNVGGPGGGTQLSPAPPRPTPPPAAAAQQQPSMHSFPAPMFAPPLAPPPVSAPSPLSLQSNPNPFSADSLFQSNQADMLRRELDNRFLASQDRSMAAGGVAAPSYLRTEMHQHQHHHTHVHQHAAPILPPPPAPSAVAPPPSLFPPPLFKEIPKMGSVDSPFYRQNLGLSTYPGYSPGMMHPGIGGPTPFVPPSHLPAFQPKQPLGESAKPKIMKSGKWNAMHVRVAWEIYHHQQKQQADLKPGGVGAKSELLRPPSHVFPGGLVHPSRPPHEIPFHRGPPFDTSPHPGSLFAAPPSHLAGGVSPFGRYGSTFPNAAAFGMPPFPPPGRDLPPLGALHDPWGRSVSALQRTVAGYSGPGGPWGLKPDPVALERREQEERERIRRERERERERERKQQLEQQERERERERERREKERREMERRELERLHQQRLAEKAAAAAAAVARDRSPLRNGTVEDIRVKEEPRPKDDDVVMISRTDPRYHPYLRHPPSNMIPPPPRPMMPPGLGAPTLPPHFAPPPSNPWPSPGDPFRDPYRFDPLRYNPLMEAAMRAEEERVKIFGTYVSHLRPGGKDPAAMMHTRPNTGPGPPPPPHLAPPQAKDDSSQSR